MPAIFVGRFQPFHKGHLKAIKWILKREKEIFIVVGSSQESLTEKNPFSFSERKEMIAKVLKAEKIKNFKIFGIEDMEDDTLWAKKILKITKLKPEEATVYTKNPWTKECFEKIGVKVKSHPIFFNKLSATEVRERIKKGERWKHLVPKEIWKHLEKFEISHS